MSTTRDSLRAFVNLLAGYLLPGSRDARSHLLTGNRPFHASKRSRLERFRNGALTVATMAKCCEIEDPSLPCRAVRGREQMLAPDRIGAPDVKQ